MIMLSTLHARAGANGEGLGKVSKRDEKGEEMIVEWDREEKRSGGG